MSWSLTRCIAGPFVSQDLRVLGKQSCGAGHSPGSDVEGPVHDHDHLDVQSVPLRAVPSWLVAHKHRILFCICEKRRWGNKGKRKSSQALPGQGEKGGCLQNKTIFKSDHATIFHLQWVCYFRKNYDGRVLFKRMIMLQFHFQMVISLHLYF